MRKRHRFALVCAVFLAVPALVGAHMGVQQLLGNFHEVIPGEFYRSSQPDAGEVAEYVERYGIRTIVNLRDEEPDEEMRGAREAATRLGVETIDYPMSSARFLDQPKAEELAQLLRDVPKPVLVHCDHGSNRTGLASAIYVGAVAEGSELQAEFQISPYYGHVPIPGIGRYEMYRSWDAFEETIGF
ncbi:tyrosine-protein phosphatase [Aureimonas populi]|uniref:Tyrosine-protein phosphatase n=1 Tax=Aureimonas populi TaxID=1701758 RepID=A0ABW5CJ93_9HYPH|nr:tyrosine-protein phosphatase [Aureimonas populi]